jgi:hypothetical protein
MSNADSTFSSVEIPSCHFDGRTAEEYRLQLFSIINEVTNSTVTMEGGDVHQSSNELDISIVDENKVELSLGDCVDCV